MEEIKENKIYVKRLKPNRKINLNKSVIKVEAKWCGACQNNKSKYENIAFKNQNISFYRVDIDVFSKEKSSEKIINKIISETASLPTFYFIQNEKVVGKIKGYDSKKFQQNLDKLINE